jgi:hypothetical protein
MSKNHRLRSEGSNLSASGTEHSLDTSASHLLDETPPDESEDCHEVKEGSPTSIEHSLRNEGPSWSSWAWSFVVSEGDPSKESGEESEVKSHIGVPTTQPPADPPALHMVLLIGEATVTFKTVQTPSREAFFSKKKPQSSPVMRVHFKGCHGRFSIDPKAKFFGFYQGFMGIESYIIGKCTCSKFHDPMSNPSFGSVDSSSSHKLESLTESLIFRMGEKESSANLLQGSLFDLKFDPDSFDMDIKDVLCPSEAFSAFWFFYDYFDIGEERVKEECTEGVCVGSVEGVFCAEVFHCFKELLTALDKSFEMAPRRSTDYIIIGDPEAKTNVLFNLQSVRVVVPIYSHNTFKSGAQDSVAGCSTDHVVVCGVGCHVHGTVAMYSGNASDDVIQHTSVQGEIPDLTLCVGMGMDTKPSEPVLRCSSLSLQYHSQDSGTGSGRSYVQFGSEKSTLLLQIPGSVSTAAVFLSWQQPCDAKRQLPALESTSSSSLADSSSRRPALKVCLENSSFEVNRTMEYSSYTAVIGQVSGWLSRQSAEVGHQMIPVIIGPIKSSQLAKVGGLREFPSSQPEVYMEEDSALEGFLSTPLCEPDSKFSTLELKTSGVLVMASTKLLTFFSEVLQSFTDLCWKEVNPEGEEEEDQPPSPPPLVDHGQPLGGVGGRSIWTGMKLPPTGLPQLVGDLGSVLEGMTALSEVEDSELKSDKVEEMLDSSSNKEDTLDQNDTQSKGFFEIMKSTAMELSIKPIVAVFASHLDVSGESPSLEGNPLDVSPAVIHCIQTMVAMYCDTSMPSSTVSSPPNTQVLVLSLPELHLTSALVESSSLSEPIVRGDHHSSLPWQLNMTELSLYTFDGGVGSNMLRGLSCEGTIATTATSKMAKAGGSDESVNVHLNFQPVVVGVSRHQVELISTAVSAAFCAFVLPRTPVIPTRKHSHTNFDSGMGLSTLSASVVAESPGHSVVSVTPLPHLESHSGTTSSLQQKQQKGKPPSLLLWLQATLPKVTLKVYSEQDDSILKFEVLGEDLVMSCDHQVIASEGKLSLAALDTHLLKRSRGGEVWESMAWEGALFSSHVSVLGKELSSAVAMEMSSFDMSTGSSPHQRGFPYFLSAKYKAYREIVHKAPVISISVQPFEGVLHSQIHEIFLDLSKGLQPFYKLASIAQPKKEAPHNGDPAPPKWPSVQIKTSSFRVLLPNETFTKLVICQCDGVQGTSNLDYAVSRFVLSESAFCKVRSSVREKKRPPLTAYQLDFASVSLWACSLEAHTPELYPIMANTHFRFLYSPKINALPLDLFPTSISKSKVVTACGHNLEISLTSPLNILVTPPGTQILYDIMPKKDHGTRGVSQKDAPPTSKYGNSDPFQLTCTGQMCTVVTATLPDDPTFGIKGPVIPIFLLSVQNPIFMMKSATTISDKTVSIFNISASASEKMKKVFVHDLFKRGSVSNMEKIFPVALVDTRQGRPIAERSGVSPSFLTAHFTSNLTSHMGNLCVEVMRPCKFALTHESLQLVVRLASQVRRCFNPIGDQVGSKNNRDSGRNMHPSPQQSSEEGSDESAASDKHLDREGEGEGVALTWFPTFRTSQVLFEYVGKFGKSLKAVSVGWEELRVMPKEDAFVDAKLNSFWIKMKSLGSPSGDSYVVMPTNLSAIVNYHKICSSFDIPYPIVTVSIPILKVRISQYHLAVLLSFVEQVKMCALHLGDNQAPSTSGKKKKGDCEEDRVMEHYCEKAVSFQDDLRNGSLEFVFETDKSSDNYTLPEAGFIKFCSADGSEGVMPTMTWKYGEPRCITQISTMPVPFDVSVTTSQNQIDMSLSCLLQYYNNVTRNFVTLRKFYLSGSVCTTFNLQVDPIACQSRLWRVCVVALEWSGLDDRNDSSLSEMVAEGIINVVSPTALAGSMRVDSVHLPGTVPTLVSSMEVGTLDVTLLNHYEPKDSLLNGFSVVTSSEHPFVEEEVVQVVLEGCVWRMKTLQNSGVTLALSADRIDGRCVDFHNVYWRHSVCISKPKLELTKVQTPSLCSHTTPSHHHSQSSVKQQLEMVQASVTAEAILCDISPSVCHSSVLLLHSWKAVLSGEFPQPAIFSHYIIFNNTLEDIHIGQVETEENVKLPVQSCLGYGWRDCYSNKERKLRLSLGGKAGWRWSKSFSLIKEGTQHVELPTDNRQVASVFIKVSKISGCQRLITFCGNWILSSQLPINLQFKLETVLSPSSVFKPTDRDISGDLMGLFPTHTTLPSCLAPDGRFAAVYFAGVKVEDGETWSQPMPLALSKDKWAKPHLLIEIPISSGDKLQCWYSVTCVDEESTYSPIQITLAPLFSVRCYLPFDVEMKLVCLDTQQTLEVPAQGFGCVTELLGLSVDTEYSLSLLSDELGVSLANMGKEPVILSTKLLGRLPLLKNFSTHEKNKENFQDEYNWVISLEGTFEGDFVPEPLHTFVPTVKGTVSPEVPNGPLLVSLSGTMVGTVVVDIKPQYLLVNRLPVGVGVVYPNQDTEGSGERYGQEESAFIVESGRASIMKGPEFLLQLLWTPHCRLSSQKLTAQLPRTKKTTSLVEQIFLTGPKGIMAAVCVEYKEAARTTMVTVQPRYMLHNKLSQKIHVCPFRFSSKALLNFSYEELHPLEVVEGGCSSALLYWQVLAEEQTMRAVCVSASEDAFSWSLPLSLKFVRHSFALPVSEHVGETASCLLTCHEQSDGCVYLVLARDPVARVQVQNLCRYPIDVVEAGSRGIHAVPLTIQPGHQTVYEPPTMAKVYPMVFGEDENESEDISILKEKLESVSLCLRDASDKLPGVIGLGGPDTPISRTSSSSSLTSSTWCPEEWSRSIPLKFNHDHTIQFSSGNKVFVTGFQKPHSLQITILPAGDQSAMCPVGSAESSLPSCLVHRQQEVTVNAKMLSLTVQEEQTGTACANGVFSVTGEQLFVHYEHNFDVHAVFTGGAIGAGGEDGRGRLQIRLHDLQVDNELEDSVCEYKVLMVAKRKLEWPSSMFTQEEEPLVDVSVVFHCSPTHCIQHLRLALQPIHLQVEDAMLAKVRSMLDHFAVSQMLSASSSLDTEDSKDAESQKFILTIPSEILQEADRDQFPLMIESFEISPIVLHVNARATVRLYLSCDDLPLSFEEFRLTNVFSNWLEVSQLSASHYTSAIFMKIGWAIGSLEILGSPATWLRNVARGMKDFFTLPYEGITRSPAYFIWGLGQGSASLVRHVASGSLRSLSSLSAGIGRNVERLSMDERHITELQMHRSQLQSDELASGGTLSSGIVGGITSFGISIVSAVRGLVDQPAQEITRQRLDSGEEGQLGVGGAARGIITGVSKGVVGVVTKPVGGAMDFVAHSTEGIRHGLGLTLSLELSKVRQEQRSKLVFPENKTAFPLVRLLNGRSGFMYQLKAEISTSPTGLRREAAVILYPDELMIIAKSQNAAEKFDIPKVFPLKEYLLVKSKEWETPGHGDAITDDNDASNSDGDAITNQNDAIPNENDAITTSGDATTCALAVVKRRPPNENGTQSTGDGRMAQLWPQPPFVNQEEPFLTSNISPSVMLKGEVSAFEHTETMGGSEMFLFCISNEALDLLQILEHYTLHSNQVAFFSI